MPKTLRLNDLGFENIQMLSSDLFNANKLILGKRIDAWYLSHFIRQHSRLGSAVMGSGRGSANKVQRFVARRGLLSPVVRIQRVI